MQDFSQEAINRPQRTMQAAEIVRQNAPTIEQATANASGDDIIVVLVKEDLTFGGVRTIAREKLVEQMSQKEGEGGWSLIFSPKTSTAEIEQRCDELAGLASKRWEILQRRANRQGNA